MVTAIASDNQPGTADRPSHLTRRSKPLPTPKPSILTLAGSSTPDPIQIAANIATGPIGPVAMLQIITPMSCFCSATLAWNYSAVDRAKAAKTSKVSASGKKSTRGKSAKSPANVAKETPAPRARTTKTEQCLALLSNLHGATIDELQSVTGWQAHSVRGFLAGTVKKKLGLILDSQKAEDSVRRYRVVQAGA